MLQAELLALPCWAGLFHQLEADPALAPHERVPARLVDFVGLATPPAGGVRVEISLPKPAPPESESPIEPHEQPEKAHPFVGR